jgi:hypothetical protein
MINTPETLQQHHKTLLLRLASGLGGLRMLAVGAPFAAELVELAEADIRVALEAARKAETLRAAISRQLGETSPLDGR